MSNAKPYLLSLLMFTAFLHTPTSDAAEPDGKKREIAGTTAKSIEITTAPAPSSTDSAAIADESVAPDSDNSSAGAASTNGANECFPACRDGFLCHQSKCISACNPPCENGDVCTAQAMCVPRAAPAVRVETTTEKSSTELHTPPPFINAEMRHNIRMKYRKIPRLMFSSDIGGGTLKDSDIDEVSFHLGIGFRKNIVENFGVILRTDLLLGYWEDNTVAEADRSYDAIYSTRMRGFDVELMPYVGPLHRFYFGPIANYRLLRPVDNQVLVDVDPWYGDDVVVKFPDEQFFSLGLGGGFLLGPREMVNLNWQLLSSFTQRMPFYIQIGVSFDVPLIP